MPKAFYKVLSILVAYLVTIHLNLYIREHKVLQKQDLLYRLPVQCYLSIKNIIADYYWFDLSYAENLSADYVFNRADLITDLDPHFTVVFRYAGVYLTTHEERSDLAIKLLEKGLDSSVNRADWRISFYLAHNYHHSLKDNNKASYYYQQAAEQSSIGEPPHYLNSLAKSLIS